MERSTKKKKSEFKRVYKNDQEFDHDLFKLEPSFIEVNESPYEDQWKGERKKHSHFYHTFDSSGNKHTHSSPMLGHTHLVEWDGEGEPVIGPAVKQVRVKKIIDGQKRTVKEWRKIDERSQHSHDVSYLVSQKIKPRKYNDDAAKAMNAKMSSVPSAPAGVE